MGTYKIYANLITYSLFTVLLVFFFSSFYCANEIGIVLHYVSVNPNLDIFPKPLKIKGDAWKQKTKTNVAHQETVVLESNKRPHKCPSLGPWCLGMYYYLFLLWNKKFKKEENDKMQPNHI